jgi:hypothetical protein
VISVAKARPLCIVELTRLGYAFPVIGMCTVPMHFHNATLALCYAMGATCTLLEFAVHPAELVFVKPVMTKHTTLPWLPPNISGTAWSASLGAPLQPSLQLCGIVMTAVNPVMLMDQLHHCLLPG